MDKFQNEVKRDMYVAGLTKQSGKENETFTDEQIAAANQRLKDKWEKMKELNPYYADLAKKGPKFDNITIILGTLDQPNYERVYSKT